LPIVEAAVERASEGPAPSVVPSPGGSGRGTV
jgi:hypothetical protein